MTAYVDDAGILWRGKKRFHMTADSLSELHEFANAVGIKRCWFHVGARHPHYDVTEEQRHAALSAGALAVDSRQLLKIAKKLREPGELALKEPSKLF